MKKLSAVEGIKAVAVIALLLIATQAQATIVYTCGTTTGNQPNDGPWMLGEDFTVNTPGNVTAVGAFDNLGDGLFVAPVYVAIYDATTGLQVPGTAMPFSGSVGTPIGAYRYQALGGGGAYLATGTYCLVAANYGGAGTEKDYNAYHAAQASQPNALSFNTVGGALTMGNARWNYGTSLPGNLSALSLNGAGLPHPVFGAGSFDFTPVPEVAVFGTATVGLLGLVFIVRYVGLRRRMKLA